MKYKEYFNNLYDQFVQWYNYLTLLEFTFIHFVYIFFWVIKIFFNNSLQLPLVFTDHWSLFRSLNCSPVMMLQHYIWYSIFYIFYIYFIYVLYSIYFCYYKKLLTRKYITLTSSEYLTSPRQLKSSNLYWKFLCYLH